MLKTCYDVNDETHASAKSLKADLSLGINPQLQPGAGAEHTAAGAVEFGVQCLFSAFAQYEGTGMEWRPDAGAFQRAAAAAASSYSTAEDDGMCHACFENFTVAVAPSAPASADAAMYGASASYEYVFPSDARVVANTSDIVDGCDCLGLFPVPQGVCLHELAYLSPGTRFRCSASASSNFLNDFAAFLTSENNVFNWWKNYIFAT